MRACGPGLVDIRRSVVGDNANTKLSNVYVPEIFPRSPCRGHESRYFDYEGLRTALPSEDIITRVWGWAIDIH